MGTPHKMLSLFRENSAVLFTRKISHQPRDTLVNPDLKDRRHTWRGHQPLSGLFMMTASTPMRAFEVDLKYWVSCLQEYKVQRYIHDSTAETGEHIDNITVNLSMFIEPGVRTIRFVQQHVATNLLNLPILTTFFSPVAF